MVNLVIVSHSAQLGEGVGALARQMLMGDGCKLAIAAGIDDPENPIGTDPIKVMEAIESVADTDHVLVMMDIGSALLSAETALELLDPDIAAKVRLCAAPLVEGTLAATVSASAGADIEQVIRDAMHALDAKCEQLGLPSPSAAKSASAALSPDTDARSIAVVVKNPNGIHVRPASRLVSTLSGFNADMWLEKNGKCVVPDSLNQITLLQVRCNDTLRLIAKGEQAEDALAAFKQLAAENFGESLAPTQAKNVATQVPSRVTGTVIFYTPFSPEISPQPAASLQAEQQRLQAAIQSTLNDLSELTALAEEKYSADIAAIFSGHHTLLDDPELFDMACDVMREKQCSAACAWQQVLSELSQQYLQLDDPYLQARYIDIEDLLSRSLQHLTGATAQIPTFSHPTILVADVIYPSTVLQLDPLTIKGICLRAGSEASHPAIIAREMGLCWMCQLGETLDSIKTGDTVTLDCVAHRITHTG
ncbi:MULTISPECIES: dihydroxyacetone kinase phosphoryl donor subunit DhaM [Citrobacter]|uniref:dihydroxyacetone kinase phosphoryl donor subunit DhaM n=1 Tax=Citrobacter TaxID=544 RepID=UPI001D0B4101|nr:MULTISPECIES: dihydroxyacetone kinase phosphoryl donor subunit DhaM [Citrobacter]MBQ4924177.1 dihydroxyacetone kinase subunit DhaM [Citrobacter werkmanii]MBQ4936948.1 dihydroxyacetone kinase subunit DhaM [Citrobacter werkmanii]MBQ4949813.1 dihydroxyacetone kinase subunit DhaM [Citrobacter werkmanii]MBQ4965114.1 dihydroxyacetone kinase subunit DhaM [Citrobacter werkmanii]MDM3296222.1 dihydroxyacetone kinase phosphoryl donor subunit DhaM [Citrobacter sp. Cc139]